MKICAYMEYIELVGKVETRTKFVLIMFEEKQNFQKSRPGKHLKTGGTHREAEIYYFG